MSRSRLLVLILLATPVVLAAQAKPSKTVAPKAIADSFHQAYPHATILNVSKEREKGRTIYEVESRDGATHRDLLYSIDGRVIEAEETIPVAELPPAVRSALATAAPGATILRTERVTREGSTRYEIGIRVGGKSRELVFDPTGMAVKP